MWNGVNACVLSSSAIRNAARHERKRNCCLRQKKVSIYRRFTHAMHWNNNLFRKVVWRHWERAIESVFSSSERKLLPIYTVVVGRYYFRSARSHDRWFVWRQWHKSRFRRRMLIMFIRQQFNGKLLAISSDVQIWKEKYRDNGSRRKHSLAAEICRR